MTLAKRPEKYRFAIVGGGSAGCLLARRLVEADVGLVVLIEAGDTAPSVLSAVPNFYPRLFGSRRDWAHQTQPQAGLNGRRIAWPRGKLLGGSGAINALIYLQAAQADLARWGWRAEELDKVPVKPPVELAPVERDDLPEFQTHFTPTHYLKYPHARNLDASHLTLAVTDLHPHSRRRLRLVGSGVDLRLSIEPEYLSDERDIARMLAGLKWHLALAQQPALRKLIGERVLPGPRRDGDSWLEKAVRTFAQSIYHPVATCRMDSPQARGESAAVVDHEFRVHGCQSLRIVDASVLPDLPSCNTNAVTCLLAEMAAYMILKEA